MRIHLLILFSLVAGLFSGCSQSDSGSDPVIVSSGSMSIGVSLPCGTTRVLETADATKGLITTWESTDALQVYHNYTENGVEGAMQGFTFSSKGTGSSTTFAYSGAEGYSFTPNSSSLYGFNALPTASNYMQTYNSSSYNFTLSLSGYGSQDGTVSNLKNYDAMYGFSSVNNGGTPAAMTMSHLMSVLRFDLTNAAFTGTLTSVVFTYTPFSGSSLLPSSGSFEMMYGRSEVTSSSLTGATSWTVSNVAASSGTAPVYLMTFPDGGRSGTLTITATASDGSTYSRTITLSALLLTSGCINAYTVTLNKQIAPKYYKWDATAEYVSGVNNYSTIISGVATNSCKDCPTYDQIQMYVGAGTYWDSTTHWTSVSGITYTGGLWLKKKAYISGFDAGTATKLTSATPTAGVPSNTSEYFFLPALGYMYGSYAITMGSHGYYWSSTPVGDPTTARLLDFTSSAVYAGFGQRNGAFCLWSVQ